MTKNVYTLFKGALKFGVPYLHGYNGDPHYVIVLDDGNDGLFRIVADVKSDSSQGGPDGYHVLYTWNQFFDHPMVPALKALPMGLAQPGFPKLDYVHDPRLLELGSMRPIAFDTDDETNDINDVLDGMLQLDRSTEPVKYVYPGKSGDDLRKGWTSPQDVIVYGFGFLFEPKQDGLHETHMNQGNPKPQPGSHIRDHSSENGPFQDGAVIVQVGDSFEALFVAFQTQLVPTDNRGRPVRHGAHPILTLS
ncbi:DUF2278 family protein [Paraburkholderia sp. CI3]|uniref:DUF2278 family protein n=1 Tax=Paraburkholderia sp. CI3 TaxID=2991060 RepID=UPI003D1D4B9B